MSSSQSEWVKVQKDLIKKDLLAEFEVQTITYSRIGGYKATPYSLELGLFSKNIAKSIKGVWRWWARAAIVGAFNGKIDYKEANNKLAEIFGSTKRISRFKLEVTDIYFEKEKYEQICKTIDEKVNEIIGKLGSWKELPNVEKYDVYASVNPSESGIYIKKPRQSSFNEKEKEIIRDYAAKYNLQQPKIKNDLIYFDYKIHEELAEYTKIPRIKILFMPHDEKVEDDTLKLENIDDPKVKIYIQRIKEEAFALLSKNLKFKIKIYGIYDQDINSFAIYTLLLALILGGIGSLTKRGFGSLSVVSIKVNLEKFNLNEIEWIKDKDKITGDELEKRLNELCKKAVELAKKIFGNLNVQSTVNLPSVPSLSNIRIKVIECRDFDLVKIGNAFLKQRWKKEKGMSVTDPGFNLDTWIAGLPRSAHGTGYFTPDNKSGRRISAIGVRCFKKGDSKFLILYGLASRDWPILVHKGRHGRRPVKKSVESAFDEAFAIIESIL